MFFDSQESDSIHDFSIDGQKFKVYELDTIETISDRVAVEQQTLPEYIKLTGKDKDKKVINLVKKIKNYHSHQLEKFYEDFKEYFPQLQFNTFAHLWYLYSLKNGKKMDPYIELTLQDYLKIHSYSLYKLETESSSFENNINKKLKLLNENVEENLKEFKILLKQQPIHSTPIEILRVKTEMTFEVDYDIYELFNYMKMSRDIPFAVIGSYYKIMEGFIPTDKWSYSTERLEGDFGDKRDVLYIKTLNVKNEPQINFTKTDPNLYSTISIYFETPQEESKRLRNKMEDEMYELEKELKNKKKKEDKDVIIRRKKKGEESKSNSDILTDRKKKKKEEKEEEEKLINEERRERELKLIEIESKITRKSKVYMRLDSPINPDLSEKNLIERILNSFPSKITILSSKQVQIKGEFLIPDFYLERPLFLDQIMNSKIFYKRTFIDERNKIQKEKGGVYLYFSSNNSDNEDKYISISMTEQVVEKTNLKIISMDNLLRPETPYLKIRITNISNEIEAEKFKNIFTRLLSLYNSNKDKIKEKYEEYIPNISTILDDLRNDIEMKRRRSDRTKEMLKDINPDQFISGYSRWLCPTKRAPRIVGIKDPDNDEEPDDIRKMQDDDGIQVMLFPKNKEEDRKQYKQYYYACDHHNKGGSNNPIYPALRLNALSNSDKYPIVPCCYTKDHRSKEKSKSILRMYYEDDKTFSDFKDIIKKEEPDGENHIYKTNKILPPKRMGELIGDVNSYFKSIDNINTYFRQGVTRSTNSVIECLLIYTEGKEFENFSKNEKHKRVKLVREELSNISNSDIYQQMIIYSHNPESLSSYLKDENKYFDPKLFTRLLENYFKCKLFIFSQNNQYPFGILSCPYHLKEYVTIDTNPSYPIIFLYEHIGSELDNTEYPQCEIIVRVDSKSKTKISFDSKYDIVKRTKEIFNEMYFTKEEDKNIIISFHTPLVGQGIDFYGKCRFLSFSDGVCILTNPLPPLNLPLKYKYKTTTKKLAEHFIKREEANKIKNHIVSGKLVGFEAQRGYVKFYIPIDGEDTQLENEVHISTPSFLYEKSEMDNYNNLNRLARYLQEYTLYLFSLYCKKTKIENESIASILMDFAKKNIEIDPSFIYSKVPRLFSLHTGVLRDEKLIVHNKLILKKLIYTLRIQIRNNKERVINYSEYKYIQRYYENIKDFDQSESQLIIYGQHALIKWIESNKIIYPLYDSIQHRGTTLLSELLKHDHSKPFIVCFFSKWDKSSQNLKNRIVFPAGVKVDGKIKKKDLITEYGNKFNFLYIDIDTNRELTSNYNVSSIPFIIFIKILNGIEKEIHRINCGYNTNENVKLIKSEILSILLSEE